MLCKPLYFVFPVYLMLQYNYTRLLSKTSLLTVSVDHVIVSLQVESYEGRAACLWPLEVKHRANKSVNLSLLQLISMNALNN